MKLYNTSHFIIILISSYKKSQEKIKITTQNISNSLNTYGNTLSKNHYKDCTSIIRLIKQILDKHEQEVITIFHRYFTSIFTSASIGNYYRIYQH